MEQRATETAYFVHSLILSLGQRAFAHPKLRPAWKAVFDNALCFSGASALDESLQDRKRAQPFVRHLGAAILGVHNIHIPQGLSRSAFIEVLRHKETFETYFDERQRAAFGYDPELEDERMNFISFELSKPLFLRATTSSTDRASGRVFVHLYPSGYIVVLFAIATTGVRGLDAASRMQHYRETQPWRDKSVWTWHSRLRPGSLREIFEAVKAELERAIFVDPAQRLRAARWRSTLKLVTAHGDQEDALDLIQPGGKAEVLALRGPYQDSSMVVTRQGSASVISRSDIMDRKYGRRGALRLFWRFVELSEFVALKQQVYEDYTEFLRDSVESLRDHRLSLKRKLTRESLAKLQVYDTLIPRYAHALDAHVRTGSLFQRRVYSAISSGTGFDERRTAIMKYLDAWEAEVEKWEPPFLVLWKKVIAPIRQLLGKGAP